MGLIKNRLLKRFGPAGRMADAAIVGSAAIKLAQKRGIITDETAKKFSAPGSSGGESLSVAEMVLLAGAVLRLAKKLLSGRSKNQKIIIDV